MKKIQVLGIWGGDLDETKDKTLRDHFGRVMEFMGRAGAHIEVAAPIESLKKIQNAQPGKNFISPAAKSLAKKVLQADILIVATPVHWRGPSVPIVAFIHHVLAPLEWGGETGGGYECKGKTFATLVACDDDGAAMVASGLHDTARHMGFCSPEFSSQHINFMMRGKSEDLWQEKPEEMCSYLLREAARRRMEWAPTEKEMIAWWKLCKNL
jgi:multimeric flavodoxin WrbA